MQKWQLAAIISGIAIMIALTCGCVSQASSQQPAPATPSETPVVTSTPASTVLLGSTPTVKPTYTSIPIQTAQVIYYDVNGNQIDHPIEVTTGSTASTTAPLSGDPLPKRLTFNLAANAIERFTVQNTGKVRFDITYGTSTGADTDCSVRTAYLTLAGPGYDNVLDYHNAATSSRKVLDLKAGSYSLSTNGCKGWKVVISNNF